MIHWFVLKPISRSFFIVLTFLPVLLSVYRFSILFNSMKWFKLKPFSDQPLKIEGLTLFLWYNVKAMSIPHARICSKEHSSLFKCWLRGCVRTEPFPCPRIGVFLTSCSHFDICVTSVVDVFWGTSSFNWDIVRRSSRIVPSLVMKSTSKVKYFYKHSVFLFGKNYISYVL